MGIYRYITNRKLTGTKGTEGMMRVLVRQDSDEAEVDYKCPDCGHSENETRPWKRPFNVKCPSCGFLMRLSRLKNKD